MVYLPTNLIALQGLILPTRWDERGNVIDIAISTFDEEEYHIDHDEIWQQLLSNLRLKVEVMGWTSQTADEKRIKITSYTLLSKKKIKKSLLI